MVLEILNGTTKQRNVKLTGLDVTVLAVSTDLAAVVPCDHQMQKAYLMCLDV